MLVFCFRFRRLPSFLPPGFPCFIPDFRYSYLLFVSFRPSLFRSHSCSSGACFLVSLSAFSASLPLSFVRFRFASGYSAFCFFLSALPVLTSQWFLRCATLLSLHRFPLYFPPDFSCALSRFSYSAFLMVSFRSALLRSRSRSTGDSLRISSLGWMLVFRFLSSASALAFHYSAFCFFRLLSSWFPLAVSSSVLVFCFRFLRLPLSFLSDFSSILSRFCYLASCSFPFILRGFAPTAVPPLLAFCFGLSPSIYAFFRPLLFRFRLLSFLFLPFLLFLDSPHSCSSNARVRFRFHVSPLSSWPDLSCQFPGSRTRLSVCFLSLFPVSLPLRYSGDSLEISLLGTAAWLPFPFVHFRFSSSATWLLFLPFLLFPSPSHSDFFGARLRLSLLTSSPFFPAWFLMHSFQVSVLGLLFVSFRPSWLRSHSCSTSASLFFKLLFASWGLFCSLYFRIDPLPTTRLSALSFPFFPISPGSGWLGACLPLFRFWYLAYCDSFLRMLSCLTVAISASQLSFRFSFFPMAFALGSGYSAWPW